MSLNLIEKIESILELFQYARYAKSKKKAFHVTEIARSIASPRSHGRANGAVVGKRVHEVLWSLDPYIVLQEDEVALPFPLAAEIAVNSKKYIVFGVADLIEFREGAPIAVYEFKSYIEPDKYAETQLKIYAWLTWKCFSTTPEAFLVLGWNGRSYKEKIEVEYDVKEVEEKIKKAILKIVC